MRTLTALLALLSISLPAFAAEDYDPRGRRDPFQPPIEPTRALGVNALERCELSEIQVEGIISGIADSLATVRVGGESFLVRKGSRVGKWGGHVARITSSELVVREESTTFDGRTKVAETSISLAHPE